MNFCSHCGAGLTQKIPAGDDRQRFVCMSCEMVHYENPKIVVGCIPIWKDQVLLCRRAIEPRHGKWTLPAGYLEKGETVADGAKRETFEEATAKVENITPYALYKLAFVSQIYLMFRGNLAEPKFKPGHESLEVDLFHEDSIPWDDMAFSVIAVTLQQYFKDRPSGHFPFYIDDIQPPFPKNPL